MTTKELLSVGIDVGTTTTQLVLSRLSISNRARMGMVPRLDVDSREVVYQGPTHHTPLASHDTVAVQPLVDLIRGDYAAAGVDPSQVETGAVIITGETARTRNAEAILHGLAELAGDFVVTVAGPNLESQIAGRGAGADEWSGSHFATVVNVDIGGGSANAATFTSGKHVASSASMVGGRQITLDPSGRIGHVAPSGVAIARHLGLTDIADGSQPSLASLTAVCEVMADLVVDLVLGLTSAIGDEVALTPPMPQPQGSVVVMLSGGVGRSYYDQDPAETIEQIARFGDVGPLFAKCLRRNSRLQQMRIEKPRQTLHATVLGAASQQVTLSGSTIYAEGDQLPLKNIPVLEPELAAASPALDDEPAMTSAVLRAVNRWDRAVDEWASFAISLDLSEHMDFDQVTHVASALATFADQNIPSGQPLVLVTEKDYAQVLGQTLKSQRPSLPVVVVDQIGLGEGDFIDIGEPMFDGRVVPVSVKTLVFYQ